MSDQFKQQLAVRYRPQPRRAISARRGYDSPVGREGHILDKAVVAGQRRIRFQVVGEKDYRISPLRGGEQSPIGRIG